MTCKADEIVPYELPLTREQFSSALRKGQGRAPLHIKRCGVAGFEDLVLAACTQSLVFDAQLEGTRGWWLFNLLELAGMKEVARPKILAALREPHQVAGGHDDTWTVSQRLELASHYAQEGDEESRRAIYAKFDLQEHTESWLGGQQIVAVDGLKGLRHVVQVIGARLLCEPDYWEDDFLIYVASESLGRETVLAALTEWASADEQARAYLKEIERREQEKESRVPQKRKSLDEVLEMIEHSDGGRQWPLVMWGREASADELAAIMARMQGENRLPQLRGYLQVFKHVFRGRETHDLPDRILELAASKDQAIREAACAVLCYFCDTRIRVLAEDLLRRTPPCLDGLRLFAKNYRAGDHAILESVLPYSGNDDDLHGIVLDLVHVAHEAKDPQLRGCLRWIYEYSPCSFCRRSAVEILVELQVAPPRLLEECLWDCQEETRDLAEATLNPKPPSAGQ